MFHHEIDAIDQASCNLDDGLTWLHGSAVFDISGRKDRVLTRSYPCSFYDEPAKFCMPADSDIPRSFVLSAGIAHRDLSSPEIGLPDL